MKNPKLIIPFSVFLHSYSMIALLLIFLSVIVTIDAQNIVPFPTGTSITPLSGNLNTEMVYNLKMTGAVRTRDNQTVCTGFTLPQGAAEFFIIQFSGDASPSVVHHMTLYACDTVPATKPCECSLSNRSPLYSWVGYTPKVRYTGSGNAIVGGFRIGGTTSKQYLFLEMHYMHASSIPDQSGIVIHTTLDSRTVLYDLAILPVMGLGTIPANKNSFYIDTCSTFSNMPGNTFIVGYQVHSHGLGRRISAYMGGSTYIDTEIGRGNPLWPQAYISTGLIGPPVSSSLSIYSRCEFQTTGVSFSTNTNGLPKTNWQEMCMFNLVVANYANVQLNGKNAFIKGTCTSAQTALLNKREASTSKPFLPSIPALYIAASYGNVTGTYSFSGGPTGSLKINLGEENFTEFLY